MSIIYKLFERLLLNRLQPYLDQVIIKNQAGFRPNRGCFKQILALITHVENGFQKRFEDICNFCRPYSCVRYSLERRPTMETYEHNSM